MLQTYQHPPFAACSTCAILLRNIRPVTDEDEANEKRMPFDEKSEKSLYYPNDGLLHYQSECCARYVCALCVEGKLVGPFCPIKRQPSKDEIEKDVETASIAPPAYESITTTPINVSSASSSLPPPYPTGSVAKNVDAAAYIIHYLLPTDSLPTLSLKYSVPITVLRSHNKLWADHLIAGRSYILIPRSHYSGPSLSQDPVQSEEESMLKRFQVKTKCVEYDIAKLYLDEAGWDIDKAVEKWKSDERWEEQHKIPGSSTKGKAVTNKKGSAGLRKGFFG